MSSITSLSSRKWNGIQAPKDSQEIGVVLKEVFAMM